MVSGDAYATDPARRVQPTDRLASVLAYDERLIEVFVELSPWFERLRSPAMRKTMARLITVEQAALMAGVGSDELIQRLDRAIGVAADPNAAVANATPRPADRPREFDGAANEATPADNGPDGDTVPGVPLDPPTDPDVAHDVPADLAAAPVDRIVDLDVRDDLQRGKEPFSRIMAARRDLRPGCVLRLRTIFEPLPLYTVMAKQGFEHWTERLAEDDWRIWFYPAAGNPGADADARAWPGAGAKRSDASTATAWAGPSDAAAANPTASGASANVPSTGGDASSATTMPEDPGSDAGVVVLDVRGLEPPEPMIRTLESLERLPEGGMLVQINVRVPRFLLPELEARGFTYEIHVQAENLVRVFIRRHRED